MGVKNYVYTDLSAKGSLTLEVGKNVYEVVQYSSSWAANEIPTAAVMLAIGRDARTQKKAAVHGTAGKLKQMEKAVVWFEPRGEYDRDSVWPKGRRKIFEGYFTGFAYRKVSGKVTVIGNLIHWLAALGFSSCLTKNGHVSNPTQLNAAAVLESLLDSGAGEGNYISSLVPTELCADEVEKDLWVAMKSIFCTMANTPAMSAGASCRGDGEFTKNDVALEALRRIEGPGKCGRPYTHGVPLKIVNEGVPTLNDAIASALGSEFIAAYASTNFWDKLTSQFCPMFGMAVVPMVESAIVVADTPAYNGAFWKEIKADDYDSYDMTRELHRPLRAVGVLVDWESQTKVGVTSLDDLLHDLGGCFVADSVSPGDGTVLYVQSPAWLKVLLSQPAYVGWTTGIKREEESKTATTPLLQLGGGPPVSETGRTGPPPGPDSISLNAGNLYARYAHDVYVNQMLRGQGGSFSGKLRFDIAPLSLLKINATSEKFIGAGQDDLAVTIYGCVQRVTIAINAEAGMAGSTFQLSHVRTETENGLTRTSVKEHPLFGKAIHGGGKHGSPLIGELDNLLIAGDGPVAPPPAA